MNKEFSKCAIDLKKKYFILFFMILILMKLGEVVVGTHVYYNFTKFHQNWMKNKKVFIIDNLKEVSSVKVPLRSC